MCICFMFHLPIIVLVLALLVLTARLQNSYFRRGDCNRSYMLSIYFEENKLLLITIPGIRMIFICILCILKLKKRLDY